MLTRPARDVEPSRVVDAVEHGMRLTVGWGEAGAPATLLAAGPALLGANPWPASPSLAQRRR